MCPHLRLSMSVRVCVCVCVSGVMSDSILFGLGLCHNDTDKRCEGDMALIHLHVTACSFLLCGELFFIWRVLCHYFNVYMYMI